jgi:hypothetical protein
MVLMMPVMVLMMPGHSSQARSSRAARKAVKALDGNVKEIQSEQTASTPAIQRRSADYFEAIRGRIKYPLGDADLRKIRRHCSSAQRLMGMRKADLDRLSASVHGGRREASVLYCSRRPTLSKRWVTPTK